MENALVASMPDDQFLAVLNKETNLSGSLPVSPQLKFNGSEGKFYLSNGKKNEQGKDLYDDLGESVKLHIVLRKNMIASKYKKDATVRYFSREFEDDMFELFKVEGQNEKEVIGKYSWQGLKNSEKPEDELLYGKLKYNQVLYAYLDSGNEPKLVRMKLNGSKFTYWFPYLKSFQNSNVVMFETALSKGKAKQSGGIDYFELNFMKGEQVAKDLIIKRVSQVKNYLMAYNQAVTSDSSKPANDNEPPTPDKDDIKVEDIPM